MVADFGIALAVSAAASPTNHRHRTGRRHAAVHEPRAGARREAPTRAATMYSLACVLFEMLAGEPPYSGTTPHSILSKRLMDPVPSVRRLRSTVPAVVDRALTRALAKAPADRFAIGRRVRRRARAGGMTPATGSAASANGLAARPSPCCRSCNLSADPENEYFADGITEDVIAHLSKIRALRVISRSSVMQFKQRTRSMRDIGAHARRDDAARRQRAPCRGPRAHRRAARRRRVGPPSLGRDVRPAARRHLRHPDRRRAAHRVGARGRAVAGRTRSRASGSRPTTWRRISSSCRGGSGTSSTPPRRCSAPSRTSSARSRATRRSRCPPRELATAWLEIVESGVDGTRRRLRARGGRRDARAAADPDSSAGPRDVGLSADGARFRLGGRRARVPPRARAQPEQRGRVRPVRPALRGASGASTNRSRRCAARRSSIRWRTGSTSRRRCCAPAATTEARERARAAVELEPANARARATLGWANILSGQRSEGLADLERAVRLSRRNTSGSASSARRTAWRARRRRRAHRSRPRGAGEDAFVSPYHLAYVYTGLGEPTPRSTSSSRRRARAAGPPTGSRARSCSPPLREHPRFRALLRECSSRSGIAGAGA